MFHSDKELFQHMLDEIRFLEEETKAMSREAFLVDAKSQRAFARSIESIGEAVKNLFMIEIPELKNHLIRIIEENRETFSKIVFNMALSL